MKMKLSAAIRLGAHVTKPVRGWLVRGSEKDLKACALGAALVAVKGPGEALRLFAENAPDETVGSNAAYRTVRDLWPELRRPGIDGFEVNPRLTLEGQITGANDMPFTVGDPRFEIAEKLEQEGY